MARTQSALSESFAKSSGHTLRFAFGASGMLARQIENGAPFDVFLSANEGFVRNLASSGRVLPGSIQIYAQGRLGLWSRSGRIKSFEDLTKPGIRHIAIANPLHAPYGLAAQQALKRKSVWHRVVSRIVYAENVQQALQFAETGNADAVITSWSLIYDRGGVLVPADLHAPIRQMGAVVRTTRHPDGAAEFLKFLTGPAGHAILRRYGFD